MLLAHADSLVASSSSSLPVVGTPVTSLLVAIFAAIVLLAAYFVIDRIPRHRKAQLSKVRELRFVKLTIGFIVGGMMAAGWDVWWHRAVGRDSFWEPPHMFLYSFAILGILTALFVWRHSRERIWKRIAFVLMLVPLSAPFDNFWHVLFGVENLTRPISLSWAPPHMLLSLSVFAAMILLLKVLLKHRSTSDFLIYASICFAGIFSITTFLLMPFHSTEGWGQVLGFAGAGVMAFAYVCVALANQEMVQNEIGVTLMMVFTLILLLTGYGKETTPKILLLPHDRSANWLWIFAYLVFGLTFDSTRKILPAWTRSTLASVLWAGILFGYAPRFFGPQFQYGWPEIMIAVLSAAVGGLAAGFLMTARSLNKA